MMKTTDDILDINPIERMEKLEEITVEKRSSIAAKRKELEELEKSKKLELDELDRKKRKELEELEKRKAKELDDLDKKRKELSELESKKVKEIEETQELIEKSFQDLMRHKRILMQEEDERSRKKGGDEGLTLEGMARNAQNIASQMGNMNYGRAGPILQEPQRLYDVANSGFYTGLTELRNKAAMGQITPEEELLVERMKARFENFNNNDNYMERDRDQYVKRSMNIIEQIGNYKSLHRD